MHRSTNVVKTISLPEQRNTNQLTHTPRGKKLTFGECDGFLVTVRRRVDEFFISTGRRRRDCAEMYLKTAVALSWLIASYVLLVFWAAAWWQALPLAISLGVAIASVGFNVQHDGAHGAYSKRTWINTLMATMLDLLGASSFVWKRKHNLIHHSFTNITGHDEDINLGVLGRLSPHQRRFSFHRLQHIYLWALYGMVSFKWHLYDDFKDIAKSRIGGYRFGRPKARDLIVFFGGKLSFFSLALVIPMLFHSWWIVLAFYFVATFMSGLVLSVVFQMAHCVEEADFPLPLEPMGQIENAWAVHQVQTTVDFARRSWLVTWFTGGLNYQIEHHLFPRICHVNYPAISGLVEKTCREFGVKYAAHDSFRAAIASHFRWLRRMGMKQTA